MSAKNISHLITAYADMNHHQQRARALLSLSRRIAPDDTQLTIVLSAAHARLNSITGITNETEQSSPVQ